MQILDLKVLYWYYWKKYWLFEKMFKYFKKVDLVCSIGFVVFIVLGIIVGVLY